MPRFGHKGRKKNLLDPVSGPGKFEGELELARVLYDFSLDSGQDEDVGAVDEGGYFMLFLGLTPKEVGGKIGKIKAAIVEEDSQGFVSASYYESDAEAQSAWDEIVDSFQGDGDDDVLDEEDEYEDEEG